MSPAPLWLALRLPALALEAPVRGMAERETVPLAVVAEQQGATRVIFGNALAARRGVAPGLALTAALALVPELIAVRRDVTLEQSLLQTLGVWAYGRSSRVVVVTEPAPAGTRDSGGEQGLLLEVGASRRLLGAPDALAEQAAGALATRGFSVRWALAPTPLAAWWLAAFRNASRVAAPTGLAAALAPLPLELLGLPGDTLAALRGTGLTCLGELAAQPRDALARRLGPELPARLDRALGLRPDPRVELRPPPVFRGRMPLPAPAGSREALRFPLRRLLEELQDFLLPGALAVQALRLTLALDSREVRVLEVGMGSPTRDARRLARVAQARLEGVELPEAVLELRLEAENLVGLEAHTPDLFAEDCGSDEDWEEVRTRLEARLGAGSVQGLALAADWRPERAWRHVQAHRPPPVVLPAHRPLWLLAAPQALPVQDGHPCLGGVLRLCRGPERIEGGWWDGADVTREYFVAEAADGQRVWVYRDCRAPRHWYLHGLFG